MRRYLLPLLTIAAMVSCNKQQPYNPEDHIISFCSTEIVGCVSDNSWSAGDQLGLFLIDNETQEPLQSNAKYTVNQDGTSVQLTPTSKENTLSFPESGAIDMAAYYPYQSQMQGATYQIDVTNQSDPTKIDLKVANKLEKKTSNSTPQDLKFQHKLSRLLLRIKAGEGVDLREMELKITGLKNSATYDINQNKGVFDFTGTEPSDLTLSNPDSGYNEAIVTALIIPQKNELNQIIFTLADGKELNFAIPADFISAKQRNFTLTLHQHSVELNSNTIIDWGDDLAEEVIPVPNVLIPFYEYRLLDELVNSGYDLNGDRRISEYEADAITDLQIKYPSHTTLNELRHLKNLEYLYIEKTPSLESIDISQCSKLRSLDCNSEKLDGIDVTHNTKLLALQIVSPNIRTINLEKNKELECLRIINSGITNVNLEYTKKLHTLMIMGENTNMPDISHNTQLIMLDIIDSHVTELDLSKHTNLYRLSLKNTALKQLDVSNSDKLYYLLSKDNPDLTEIRYNSEIQDTENWNYDKDVTTLIDTI